MQGSLLGCLVFYPPLLPFCGVVLCECVYVCAYRYVLCIDSPVSTSMMFCSLPDRLTQFAINTPSSRLEALPDGAGTICLADASLLTDCVCVCVSFCLCVCVLVCVWVGVCVCVRERERAREKENSECVLFCSWFNAHVWEYVHVLMSISRVHAVQVCVCKASMCVCVCKCFSF